MMYFPLPCLSIFHYLEDERNHPPSRDLVGTKLLNIPSLGIVRRRPQIGHDEEEGTQKGWVEDVAARCSRSGEADIDEAFACIVRADDVAEEALGRERVLFETSEMFMRLLLLPRCHDEGDKRK